MVLLLTERGGRRNPPRSNYTIKSALLTKLMVTTRSCCSLMLPFGPLIFLTFTEVTGGRALASFGTFFTFLLF